MNQNELLFEPQTRFDYSNSNYVLLAMIIERVTRRSYKDYLKESIFEKIGMSDTWIFDEKQPVVFNRAYGYRKEETGYLCDYVDALTIGDGGVFSTMEDLYLWDQVLSTEKLVSLETMELAFMPGKGKDGRTLEENYGFGWSIKEKSGSKIVSHSGLDAGFRSLITRYLPEQFTVIVLSNSADCTGPEKKEITKRLFELYN